MAKRQLPRVGDKIPVEKFYVSKMNVRAGEEFGVGEKDEALEAHLMTSEIVQPFIARPEGKEGHWERGMDLALAVGYGVVVGRRRYFGKRDKVTHFVVGDHVLIRELSDEEALDMSLKENLDIFRKDLDPITRADRLNELITKSTLSLRKWADKWNLDVATLSDWTRVGNLSPKMRQALRKGVVPFWDGLKVYGLKLGTELQETLGDLALSQGLEAFRKELTRLMLGKGKRGLRPGIWTIERLGWDKRNRADISNYEVVQKVAESKGMTVAEYIKDYITRHIEDIRKEMA